MPAGTLGGAVRDAVRRDTAPVCREGRITSAPTPFPPGSRISAAVRSATGDALRREGIPGAQAQCWYDGATLIVRAPQRGDACWVAEDESGALVVVAWEPRA